MVEEAARLEKQLSPVLPPDDTLGQVSFVGWPLHHLPFDFYHHPGVSPVMIEIREMVSVASLACLYDSLSKQVSLV